jgi:hypothetical protein
MAAFHRRSGWAKRVTDGGALGLAVGKLVVTYWFMSLLAAIAGGIAMNASAEAFYSAEDQFQLVKVIRCSSLRGGGGELGTIKTLTYGSN